VLGGSLALGASSEGNYQRTKDGKAVVWNGDPKPGDAASWFGGRDKDDYATGMGTLVWYRGNGRIYARYHGKMVRGKFDGTIDVQSHGKTAHAIFAEGKRLTRWTPGGLPLPGEETLQAATSPSPPARDPSSQETTAESSPASAPSPPQTDTVPKEQIVREPTPDVAQSTAPSETERPKPNSQSLPLDIPAEGPSLENPPQHEPENSTASASVPAHRSHVEPPPAATQPTITIQDKPEVRDFSGPPPSLRTNSEAEKSPADTRAETASQPTAHAQLTPQEATSLADTGAEARGYDLAVYDRPKADYSAVLGKWSLFYSARQADTTTDAPQHFTVIVNDATKEVEVKQ
jgi:hypothetical protein